MSLEKRMDIPHGVEKVPGKQLIYNYLIVLVVFQQHVSRLLLIIEKIFKLAKMEQIA